MKSRIEYSNNSTGYVWFVDAIINGGWKNVSSHKTKQEAEQVAAKMIQMLKAKQLAVQAACDAVEAGMLSGYAAAKKYGVAESSISRALKRRASECPTCGRPHYAAKTIM